MLNINVTNGHRKKQNKKI